jgi:hypothetical protein
VAGGTGRAERVERSAAEGGALWLSARGLAALYAGRPVAALRRAGLAAGCEEGDEAADAVFATSVAYVTDYF